MQLHNSKERTEKQKITPTKRIKYGNLNISLTQIYNNIPITTVVDISRKKQKQSTDNSVKTQSLQCTQHNLACKVSMFLTKGTRKQNIK